MPREVSLLRHFLYLAPTLLAFSLAAHLTFAATRALLGVAFLPWAYAELTAPIRSPQAAIRSPQSTLSNPRSAA